MSDTNDTLREQSMDDLRDYLENLEVAFDEEGEPIFLLSSDVEGILKAVRKRDAYIIGEDDEDMPLDDAIVDGFRYNELMEKRNQLRAEQRRRAGDG